MFFVERYDGFRWHHVGAEAFAVNSDARHWLRVYRVRHPEMMLRVVSVTGEILAR